MLRKLVFAIIVSFAISPHFLLAGEVYKTEKSDGNVKYTNIKPSESEDKILETRKYSHPEPAGKTEDNQSFEISEKITEEKQNYVDEIFRKRAKLLYEKEVSLKNDIKNTSIYIDDLENVVEDYLVNGYFADNYIFELRVQESNLESLKNELANIDEEWNQLKKEARKNNVDPGVLRVR